MARAVLPVPTASSDPVEPLVSRYPFAKLILATGMLTVAIIVDAASFAVAAALAYVNVWAPIPAYLSIAGIAFIAGLGAIWWLVEH